jgi:hypothetical protein
MGGPDLVHEHHQQTLDDQALRIDIRPATPTRCWRQRDAVYQGQQHHQGLRFHYHGGISSLLDCEISMIGDGRGEGTSPRLTIYDQASFRLHPVARPGED